MRVTPDPSGEEPPPEKVRSLSFYLAIFGIGILISLGLCGLNALPPSGGLGVLALFGFVLGVCCILGFILTLLAGFIESLFP